MADAKLCELWIRAPLPREQDQRHRDRLYAFLLPVCWNGECGQDAGILHVFGGIRTVHPPTVGKLNCRKIVGLPLAFLVVLC